MEHLYQILEKPLITEKSTQMAQDGNWVSFRVKVEANKIQIKEAVEKIFNVTVFAINTVSVKGKFRRVGAHRGQTKGWKKAMLLLKEGDKIDMFEGA